MELEVAGEDRLFTLIEGELDFPFAGHDDVDGQKVVSILVELELLLARIMSPAHGRHIGAAFDGERGELAVLLVINLDLEDDGPQLGFFTEFIDEVGFFVDGAFLARSRERKGWNWRLFFRRSHLRRGGRIAPDISSDEEKVSAGDDEAKNG